MSQRESKLSQRVAGALRETHGSSLFVFKVWGSSRMMRGLPDLIGCYRGHFFALEVKHPETRGAVDRRQAYVHDLIRRAGGLCEVVCTPREALDLIKCRIDPYV